MKGIIGVNTGTIIHTRRKQKEVEVDCKKCICWKGRCIGGLKIKKNKCVAFELK